MLRAGSHYERGLQAMRSGNTDQAEWEFDAALETLLDTELQPTMTAGLVGANRFPPMSYSGWLTPQAPRPRPAVVESPPADPDEPNQEAPALLGPEDMQPIDKEAAGERFPPESEMSKYEFPITYNAEVKTFLQFFQTRKWGIITRAYERAGRYLPMMRAIFREKGLPEELINLAFIESAVNPWATSKAKAAGIWQFVPSTGRLYGMRVSWWVDERRDPEKSTRGAADYLKSLYRMFDSWELALAAYNAGEGTVQRAIERQRTRNYWALRLPKETKLFVPAFMAMTIISKEPERYGFTPPPEEPLEADVVALDAPADFHSLAQAARTSPEHLRELNPALIRWSTPPGATGYPLRIPTGVKADFLEELARIPPSQRVRWVTHRIRKGDTAPGIAKRYGTDLQVVLDMNGIARRQPLKPGGVLFVPAPTANQAMATAAAGESRTAKEAARTKGQKISRHTVKKGETVARIARAYGVSAEDLRRWNGLSRNASLRSGRVLEVHLSTTPAGASAGQDSPARERAGAGAPSPPMRRHIVKRGDTLTAIARMHGVSPEDLRRWNDLPQAVVLRPGQELRIHGSAS
jgi:membrane-bound lytic murein transglycosylase D